MYFEKLISKSEDNFIWAFQWEILSFSEDKYKKMLQFKQHNIPSQNKSIFLKIWMHRKQLLKKKKISLKTALKKST